MSRVDDLKERLRLTGSREDRLARASLEQQARRAEVDARNARLQGLGVRRGASAPKCGTFGKAA